MGRKHNGLKGLATVAVLLGGSVGIANAAALDVWHGPSHAYTSSNKTTVYNYNDYHYTFTTTGYMYPDLVSTGTLKNQVGGGGTASKYTGTVKKIRACYAQHGVLPMSCGSWTQ